MGLVALSGSAMAERPSARTKGDRPPDALARRTREDAAMKVLVVSASRHEATRGIATAIVEALRDAGLKVNDLAPDDVHDIEPYDAVIIGSAIYGGDWLPEANDFVERFDAALRRKPVWLFSSGPIGDPPHPAGEPRAVERLMAQLLPRGHRTFGGRLDRTRLDLVDRTIAQVTRSPFGDYRDWPAIRAWADEIAGALAQPMAVTPTD
jgi:menaquinone-dependent protoporphyrinogen oxidase